jgi:hypothetical protein
VKRGQRSPLVWSLVDLGRAVLPRDARTWMCVKIGAGDQVEAIDQLLCILADRQVQLPEDLHTPVWNWARGYLGSDAEPRLRTLLTRLRVPQQVPQPPRAPLDRGVASDEPPRRVQVHAAHAAPSTRSAHPDARLLNPLSDSGLSSRVGAVTVPGAEDVARRRANAHASS